MKKLRIAEVRDRANLLTACEGLQDLRGLGIACVPVSKDLIIRYDILLFFG